jgi:hypothetical protein
LRAAAAPRAKHQLGEPSQAFVKIQKPTQIGQNPDQISPKQPELLQGSSFGASILPKISPIAKFLYNFQAKNLFFKEKADICT